MTFFDTFVNRYTLDIEIELVTPLHIGVGNQSISPLDSDNAIMRMPDGNAVIPGASLKGVFRSNLEAILRMSGLYVCDSTNSTCGSTSSNSSNKELYQEIEKSCEVCSLFGSQSISSHIYISDAIRRGNPAESFTSTRDGVMIRRDTENAAGGRKYDFEVVNPGTVFVGEILLENVNDYQVGYVLMILDLMNQGFIRLGGKKSAGLGRVNVTFSIQKIDKKSILEESGAIKLSEQAIDSLRLAARNHMAEVII
ncbi:MAG TPA: CRISPR-associated RAMP protein [Mesotoga infera]|uniref:CRISPR-associated RAMP protein n=1 Tax=Mesotoga infera TaxID=1236046 RepID=A0A7C1H221_9BACT|nr:CRISPR-associated RAMP protein [Mesotoga infera]